MPKENLSEEKINPKISAYKLMGDEGEMTSLLLTCNNLIKNNSPAAALCVGMYHNFPEDPMGVDHCFGPAIRALTSFITLQLPLPAAAVKFALPTYVLPRCYLCNQDSKQAFQLKCCNPEVRFVHPDCVF